MQNSEKYVLVLGLQMPLLEALEILWFKRNNITAFLEQYDDMCEDYKVTLEIKRIRLLRYISPIYKEQIRSIPKYSTENYLEKELYDALKKEFREYDWEYYRVSIEFLYRIIDQSTRGLLAIKTYVDLFDRVSKELIKRNKLNKQHQGREFMRGLPMHVKERIFRETDYEPTEISIHNYNKMYEKAVAAYKYEEKKRRYNETNDPEYSKVRQEHLNTVVQRMIPNAANDLLLLVPLELLMEEIQRRMYATAEKTYVESQSSVPRTTQT
ncbi:hypothetical protein BDZ45DRAFT_788142 [Acephala macrosclerotiorum]|nr:hypothetical protein BDZ45DRAFT_788142 [Acephala macrosclerotiorum]